MSAPAAGRRESLLPWAIWSLGAAFYSFAFFQRVAPSAMTHELMRDLAVGAAALGNLSAAYFYVYGGLQIPIGVALDRWGTRWLLMGCAALGAAGSVLFALSPDFGTAFLGRLLIGAGASVGYLGCLKLAAVWFPPRRFSLLVGFITPFGMTGAVLGQAPLGALVEAAGWRAPMLGAAGFAVVILLLLWLTRLVAPRRPEGTAAPPPSLARLRASLARSLRTPQVWIIALATASANMPLLAFAGLWGVPYLVHSYGLSRELAGLGTSVMLIGWALGAPFLGWLSERLRRRKALFLLGATVGLASWLIVTLAAPLPIPLLYTLFAVAGIGSGATILGFVLIREGVGDEASGSVSALVNTFLMGMAALFQYLIGALLDLWWDGEMAGGVRLYSSEAFASALWILPATTAVSCVAALFLRETHPSRIGRPLLGPAP